VLTDARERTADAGYKEIVVRLSRDLGPDERRLLGEAAKKLPRSDLSFTEARKGQVLVRLHSVDLGELKAFFGTGPGAEAECEVGKKIIKAIESVRSYGVRGKKRVYVGYNAERKVKGRKAREATKGKYFYAADDGFSRENAEFPADMADKIVCDDAERVLCALPGNCVDLVFTSPPYNFGLEYGEAADGINWESYFEKLFAIFDECIRVLKYGGRIVVNVQPLFSSYIPTHHFISNFFTQRKLIWKGEILWEKNNYNCKYTAWGSWKSPSNPYLKYTWEFIEIFAKGSLKKPGQRENIDITADEFKDWVVAKWSVAPERDMQRYGHPAMFPEELAYRVIKLFSFKNDVVVDPFNGAGTTTAAARRLGRRFLGIDVSEDYCQTARRRLGATLF